MATPPKLPPVPVVVGNHQNLPSDPTLMKYKKGAESRTAERAAQVAKKPGQPHVLESAAMFDPKRDPPQSVAQVAQTVASMTGAPGEQPKGPVFSPETLAGLEATKKAAEAQAAHKVPQPAAEAPEPKAQPLVKEDARRPKAEAALDDIDDWELERLLSTARSQDPLNTKEQKEAADKLVGDVDVLAAFETNEFTQIVPVIPGMLQVKYRSVSPQEDIYLRAKVFERVNKDPTLQPASAELYRLMYLAVGIVMINGEPLPPHSYEEGLTVKFDDDQLFMKTDYLIRKPLPMIHALTTHQSWFEQRVRKAFLLADVGNG